MWMALALLALAAWTFLALAHGRFWRASERLDKAPAPAGWPDVAILIPARNEAATIGPVVTAHLAARYPGHARLFLVDDQSTDGTGEVATKAAAAAGAVPAERFTLLRAPPLPEGWSGKLWALDTAVAEAARAMPGARWLLLTDADIVHGPDLLANLVAEAEAKDLALLSVMARLDARGPWGGLLIPAFIYFFQLLYPFPRVNDPGSGVAGAAGGVVLVRRDALEAIGGLASIRGALIDDCTLAARVKAGPPRAAIRLVLADERADAVSLRDNRAYGGIRDMVARTAFTQLGYSPWKLAGTLVGLGLVFLVPPALLLLWPLHGEGWAAALGALAWALMAITWVPTLKDMGRPLWLAPLLPVAALFYCWFTLLSALRHWAGRGGQWKGRSYPVG
ncbi:glycosyltransferase [Thermaurantiacus sp.]